MADKPKIIAIKPEQALAGFMGILVTFLAFQLLFAVRESHLATVERGAELAWHHQHYEKLSIEHHFPGIMGGARKGMLGKIFYWAGFGPAIIPLIILTVFVVYSVAASVFSRPEVSLLEDPEFNVTHLGVDTPEICHLPAIFHVCPDRGGHAMMEAIVMGDIDPVAPASSTTEIDDSPKTYGDK